MTESIRLSEIAELVGGELHGDGDTMLSGVAAVASAGPRDITWASSPRYVANLAECRAGAAVVPRSAELPPMPTIVCDDVEWAMVVLLGRFAPKPPEPDPGVHATATIADGTTLGEGVRIGPHVIVEPGARIGDQTILDAGVFVGRDCVIGCACRLWQNVVVRERCRIGDRVILHPQVVVGADGFGLVHRDGVQHRIPHAGDVVIGDDVEIGACSCVDRAKVGSTRIGSGVKIDNLVQVAHNVTIGEGSIICAQAGIAGSAQLGRYVVLGGQAGIRDNITLADGVMAAACSCIPQDVPAGARVAGVPAIDATLMLRQMSALKRLPDLLAQVRTLTRRIETLEAATNHPSDG